MRADADEGEDKGTDSLRRLILGTGSFVDDLRLPEILHLLFVRSPHAHARIVDVNTHEARGAPGVIAVVTADDLGSFNAPLPLRFHHPGVRHPRMPRPLAAGIVRHLGEPVAAVVAEAPYRGEDAVGLVQIEYDPRQAAVSLDQARHGGSLVHEDAGENVAGTDIWRVGDVEAALREAPVRLTPFAHHPGGG